MKCDSCGTVEATKWVGGDCEPCWLQRAREKVLERERDQALQEVEALAVSIDNYRHRAKAAEFDLENWKNLSQKQDQRIRHLEALVNEAANHQDFCTYCKEPMRRTMGSYGEHRSSCRAANTDRKLK